GQPKLMEAVALMEANLEEPMSLDELAQHVRLSRRQLERLFQKHLSCVPTRYYLDLRLAKARQLLLQLLGRSKHKKHETIEGASCGGQQKARTHTTAHRRCPRGFLRIRYTVAGVAWDD
ncbi:MAG: helix-turn-helix domain-containing protein, partial [Candidatus Acidiferrales bacterium]